MSKKQLSVVGSISVIVAILAASQGAWAPTVICAACSVYCLWYYIKEE